jgi:hypothetical protein
VKTPIAVLAIFIAASALAAVAADPPKKELTPQQQRMSDCAHESKGMKGDAHKQFMSDCLKGKTAPGAGAGMGGPKMTPQQERMKECNAEAGKTKMAAAERQKFMSSCLKGEHPMGGGGMKGPADKGGGMGGPMKGAEGKKDPKVRMTECNADAGKKKLAGAERKKFMSECLKG